MKRFLTALAIAIITGCISVEHNVVIESAKTYEGHYMTVEEFKKGTESMQLQSGESVWVLSNVTLKRLLKNTENGK